MRQGDGTSAPNAPGRTRDECDPFLQVKVGRKVYTSSLGMGVMSRLRVRNGKSQANLRTFWGASGKRAVSDYA